MGRSYTDAQAAAASRYLSGFKQFVVRLKEDELNALDAAAAAAGKSRAEFVKAALSEAIERGKGERQ